MRVESRSVGEIRFSPDGRTVSGIAMPYRERSPSHNELFLPGAFCESANEPLSAGAAVPLNLLHDPAALPNVRATLHDSPQALRYHAELPVDSAVVKMIRDGYITGASVEFHALEEQRTKKDGVREIIRARLVGLALVPSPSYAGTTAEIRHEALPMIPWWMR